MKASALKDIGEKNETKDRDQMVVRELEGDPGTTRLNISDDGKSICLIDKNGRRRCAAIPMVEPVKRRTNFSFRALSCRSNNICPQCGCLKIVIGAQIIYFDCRNNKICGHTRCRH